MDKKHAKKVKRDKKKKKDNGSKDKKSRKVSEEWKPPTDVLTNKATW